MSPISSPSAEDTRKIVAPCAYCGSEVFPLPNVPVPRWEDLAINRPDVLGLNCIVCPTWIWCSRTQFFAAWLAEGIPPNGLPGTPFPGERK